MKFIPKSEILTKVVDRHIIVSGQRYASSAEFLAENQRCCSINGWSSKSLTFFEKLRGYSSVVVVSPMHRGVRGSVYKTYAIISACGTIVDKYGEETSG